MLDFHDIPQVEVCDVCRYAVEYQLDCAYEHARTRLTAMFLLQDLADLDGGTASLQGLAVSSFGVEPGPVHSVEPRHWYWAMFYYPEVRIGLRR